MSETGHQGIYRKRGRPPKEEVKERLVAILEEKQLGTTNRLGKLYRERYGEELSWNTVKKYVTKLLEEGKVAKQVSISHSNGDQVVVYKLARGEKKGE
ncbi:hypothetical protein K9M06_01045 [Candidatus Bipolaricaulota bacterium]|nr:hypothetical protein [Candidatus Bipolaricaulota bacterium]